ncbi:MAG: hypothetical protein PHC34_05180 [Candidatus Gastranaerophilales bacterium]|nr:hypothetical protein [Candidatus Gastranaerophilales bacterium]
MILKFLSFFTKRQKCRHEKITPQSIWNYCPDCGKEISIKWFILRCNSCASKRGSMLYLNTLVPTDKHCSKCGSPEFYIEKKEKLDFFDMNYAVMTKEEIDNISKSGSVTQIWIEGENCWHEFILPKLITLYQKE